MTRSTIYIYCLLFVCCSAPTVSNNDLEFKELKFFNKKTDKPFSGEVEFKFDDSRISNLFGFKRGIPDGRWVSLGYQGEVIQEGKYTPIIIDKSSQLSKHVERISIYFFREGKVKTNDVLVILKDRHKEAEDKDKMREDVLSYLRSYHKSVLANAKIDSVFFVKSELEIFN